MLTLSSFYRKEFCTAVYNSDRTLTEISRFQAPVISVLLAAVGACSTLFMKQNIKYKKRITECIFGIQALESLRRFNLLP